MKELTKRVLFGVPAAAVFLYMVWLGGVVFQVFTGLIMVITLLEMVRMFRKMQVSPVPSLSLLTALFLWSFPLLPGWLAVSVSAGLVLATLWALADRRRDFSDRWMVSLFCGLYAPLGFLFLNRVRMIEPSETGMWLTFALILMIWGNDVFAYFGGRSFGKRPLAPAISPGKTWEGFWSGFAGAALGLMIAFLAADPFPLDLWTALPAVILVSIFGPLGDLVASRMKRLAGAKDSSGLLPGHGGFLDRFDALILCSPVVFLYLDWVM
ncbi:MAG: phosphatidate cytidylyltransferase [Balneolaceae bacterium]